MNLVMERTKALYWCGGLREIAVSSSDGHVENEIEGLVKWGIGPTRLAPGILQGTIVDNILRKPSSIPHVGVALGEGKEEDLLFTI